MSNNEIIDSVPSTDQSEVADTGPVFEYTPQQRAEMNYPASQAPGAEAFRPNPLAQPLEVRRDEYPGGRSTDAAVGAAALLGKQPEQHN